MVSFERKAAADEEEIAAAIVRDNAGFAGGRENLIAAHRYERQITSQPERSSAWEKEGIAGPQANGIRGAFHGEPALASNHRATLYASLLIRKLDRPLSTRIQTGGQIVSRFQRESTFESGSIAISDD